MFNFSIKCLFINEVTCLTLVLNIFSQMFNLSLNLSNFNDLKNTRGFNLNAAFDITINLFL